MLTASAYLHVYVHMYVQTYVRRYVCVYMSVPASPAVHNDGIIACLHLHPAHLVDEVNHAGSTLGSSSFRPGKEVELTHGPGLTGLHLYGGRREGRVL